MKRTFHSQEGLYFTRHEDGSVTITKTDGKALGEGGLIVFEQTVDAGTWVSAVLSMSAHGERGGDWHEFMKHHQGTQDLIKEKS